MMIMEHPRPDIYVGLPRIGQITLLKGRKQSDPDAIIEVVCEKLGIDMSQLTSQTRTRDLVEARCIAIGLILQVRADYGLKRLGMLLGGKHHSSIIHMNKMYNDLYLTDKKFTQKVKQVLEYV